MADEEPPFTKYEWLCFVADLLADKDEAGHMDTMRTNSLDNALEVLLLVL